jgi:hypothetical protein
MCTVLIHYFLVILLSSISLHMYSLIHSCIQFMLSLLTRSHAHSLLNDYSLSQKSLHIYKITWGISPFWWIKIPNDFQLYSFLCARWSLKMCQLPFLLFCTCCTVPKTSPKIMFQWAPNTHLYLILSRSILLLLSLPFCNKLLKIFLCSCDIHICLCFLHNNPLYCLHGNGGIQIL